MNKRARQKHAYIAAEVSQAAVSFRHLSNIAIKTNQPVNKETLWCM